MNVVECSIAEEGAARELRVFLKHNLECRLRVSHGTMMLTARKA